MKAVLAGLMALVLAGCGTFSDYQTGDFNIRTTQMGEDSLKIFPRALDGQPLQNATAKITNRAGKPIQEKNIRRGNTIIHYPMHESSIIIEITDETGRSGSKVFFRNQLREFPIP